MHINSGRANVVRVESLVYSLIFVSLCILSHVLIITIGAQTNPDPQASHGIITPSTSIISEPILDSVLDILTGQSSLDDESVSPTIQSDLVSDDFCGTRYTHNEQDEYSRIIFGMYSKHYWPWAAKFKIRTNRNVTIVCNGALLNDHWVITAGHCVHDTEARKITVFLGVMNFEKKFGPEKIYKASEIARHPDYSHSRLSNDLALVKLDRKVTFTKQIHSICLPPDNIDTYSYAQGKMCYQTGWGKTELGSTSKRLKEIRVVVSPAEVCNKGKDRSVRLNKSGNICITPFSPPGKKNIGAVCMGDSGGPAACLDPHDNRWYLVGTVSFGPKECLNLKRDTWATVSSDLIHFRDWILETISG